MAVTRALSGLLHLALLLLFVSPFGFFLYIERRNVSMLYMYASWSDVTREIHCDFRVLRSRIHCGRQMFLRGRLPYDVDGTQTFQLIRLSGDIHLNPGPPRRGIKYPCGECQRSVRRNQDAILCHQCNRWFHVKCTGMSKQTFTYYLDQYNLDWECSLCALPRLNDSFFDDNSQGLQTPTVNGRNGRDAGEDVNEIMLAENEVWADFDKVVKN